MRIGDDELDALQASFEERFRKDRPEGFGLRRPNAEAYDLASASVLAATAIMAATETMRPP
jgi:hypothetical protein